MTRPVPESSPGSERLGRFVAEQLGAGPAAQRLARQREALAVLARRRREPRRWQWGAAAAVAVAASAALWFGITPESEPQVSREHFVGVTPALGAAIGERRLQEHDWLGADSEVTVRFSDASVVSLAARTRVRLSKLRSDAVQLNVESGALRGELAAARGRTWSVLAGPYRLELQAARFSVEWGPEQARLVVQVDGGQVSLSGAALDAPRRLSAGARFDSKPSHEAVADAVTEAVTEPMAEVAEFTRSQHGVAHALSAAPAAAALSQRASGPRADERPARVTPTSRADEGAEPARPLAPSAQAAPELPPAPLGGVATREQPEPRPEAPPAGDEGSGEAQSWQQLAEQGRYSEAVQAAQALGIEQLHRASSASDLMLLADAARLSGAVAQARASLLEVRRRFPQRAALAAFSLGRLAFDVQRDPREALRWFEIYLTSAPSGPMAQGARARRLQAALQLGDDAQVRRAAQDYLEHHPDGSLAARARKLLR